MWLAMLAAAMAGALAVRPSQRQRLGGLALPHLAGRGRASANPAGSTGPASDRNGWWTSPLLAAFPAALTVTLLIGGALGVAAGAAASVGVYRWVARAESGAARRQRAQRERDLPLAIDLIGACLAAGRPPASALATVADALPGPLGDQLRAAASRLALGADPETVWRDLGTEPGLAPLGDALARSTRTGSSVTTALDRCADDLRRQRRAQAQAAARSVGVKAAAPLGACFLPAFLLIGIVPTIVGAFGTLTW